MKKVMVRAWEIARKAVVKFGGKVKEYFAQALAMAWREAKAPKYVEIDLKADTRKCRTWVAKIVGPHEVYKLDRQFLNQDSTDEFGDKIYRLFNGVYEYNNGRRREFIKVEDGTILYIDYKDVLAYVV